MHSTLGKPNFYTVYGECLPLDRARRQNYLRCAEYSPNFTPTTPNESEITRKYIKIEKSDE